MKKSGFTLVELIAVIVVLSLILIIVTPALMKSAGATRQKMYQTKISNIETAAVLFGQDHYREIVDKANQGEDGYQIESTTDVIYRTRTIKVSDLVPTYLTKDSDSATYLVKDPRDGYESLDNYTVTIKINTNTRKVTAKFNEVES